MDTRSLKVKRNHMGIVYYENDKEEIVAKVCGKCLDIKNINDYSRDKSKPDGRKSICKACASKSDKKWREDNSERKAETKHNWYEANKEHVSEASRKWRIENKERYLEFTRKWKEANKGSSKEAMRKWRRENPEKNILSRQRRRARKSNLIDDFTSEQMTITVDYFGGCALIGDITDVHWDHVIPLSTGHIGTTFGNMIPLRADLNLSKNDNNIFEWYEANRQRFELSQERFDNLIAWLASANAMTVEEYRSYVNWCHANPRTIDELEAQ